MCIKTADVEEHEGEPCEGQHRLIVGEGDGFGAVSLGGLKDALGAGEVGDEVDPDKSAEEADADEDAQGDELKQREPDEGVEDDAALRLFGEGLDLSAKCEEEMSLAHPCGESVKVENFRSHLACPHLGGRACDERQRKGVADAHEEKRKPDRQRRAA